MTTAIYNFSAPIFKHTLGNLGNILESLQDYVARNNYQESDFLTARLHPTMFSFVRQVQITTDLAKMAVAKLSDVTAPSFSDDEVSVQQLIIRVQQTIDFICSVNELQFLESTDKPINLNVMGRKLVFSKFDFLQNFIVPQFFFHATTAYAILRNANVPLGKDDFTGGFKQNEI